MDGCYRLIKKVDIEAVRPLMDRLPFFRANQGATDKCVCFAVIESQFPPELKEFIEGLNLGGRHGRQVLRKLPKGVGIDPHTDTWMPAEENWRRFQLPIVTHPDILMRWPDDGVELHLQQGILYEVNFQKMHEVINPQNEIERIHLQVDQIDATI